MFSINLFRNTKLIYIIENANWSIKWDGIYITNEINKIGLTAKTDTVFEDYKNKILHFGSRGTYLPEAWKRIDASNKVVFAYFHGEDTDTELTSMLKLASKRADFFHTSCLKTREHLIKYGVPHEKIIVIPIGVDIKTFKPVSWSIKKKRLKVQGIPEDRIVIGSFQKDGVGWGEGNDPKLIKGPDIFCDVVERLAQDFPIFVVLTGPARGYVKTRLTKAGIPFIHHFLDDYQKIPYYYSLLDLYIIASRVEGGPKAILESQACGVPVVATPVGMIPDICRDNYDVLLSESFEAEALYERARQFLSNKEINETIKENGYLTAQKYSWKNIAKQYYDNIYSKLL